MRNSAGAFAAPTMFDALLDRVATDVYPSERFVVSAALSATTTDELDRLLRVLGRQQIHHYLSPRRAQLLHLVAARRPLLRSARRVAEAIHTTDADTDIDDIDRDELEDAIELLERTRDLLA